MRSVSVRLSDLEKITIPIGFVGENLFTEVNIDCMKVFGDHPTAIPSLAVTPPEGDSYPGLVERDGDIVKWTICDSDLAYKGSGEIQLAFTVDGEMIGKSYVARTKILRSIEPSGQAPTPIANWLIEAGTTLAEVQQALTDIPAEIAEGLANLIDDTAGHGVTNKVWSAGKNYDELALKADKNNPVFTGTINFGRKANTTVGIGSIAFGVNATASASYSMAVGSGTIASGTGSHAEGNGTTASGVYSHSEGTIGTASGASSHAEGQNTTASNTAAHSEGFGTSATGSASHAEGQSTIASGAYAHSSGLYAIANHKSQFAFGEYNVEDSSSALATKRGNYVEIVGNGTGASDRSNARTLDWDGNEYLMGDVYIGCGTDSTGGTKVAKITDIPSIPEIATTTETQAIITEYVG